MSHADREKWDRKYRETAPPGEPSRMLTALRSLLPETGRALDLGGGAGRHAIWLAQHGLESTLADISAVALEIANSRAAFAGMPLHTILCDLDIDPFPPGKWDVIVTFQFLHRAALSQARQRLMPDGVWVVIQPTVRNLERHDRPPREFLLAEGELHALLPGLEILHYREGWLEEDRHEGVLVARRAFCSTDAEMQNAKPGMQNAK